MPDADTVIQEGLCIILYLIPLTPYFKAQQQKIMELTSAMDKANMNLKGAGEQNMAFAGKIQMLEVDITKIRQVRKVPKFISSKAKLFQVNHELLPYLNSFVSKKVGN